MRRTLARLCMLAENEISSFSHVFIYALLIKENLSNKGERLNA
jgi:hypothetical protein